MIPFVDLKAQYRSIRDEIREAVDDVMQNAAFALGPAVETFERNFARYVGVEHAIAVNSGTSALHLALLAAGVGPGDEVILPAMTFVATAAAVDYTGARTILVDVEEAHFTLDTGQVEAAITDRTRAIVPVHLYGQPVDMAPILEIAQKRELIVIEDAAQAHGAEYRGARCGSMGQLGCFSFYPGKNLGAYGEGGIVVTDDRAHASTIRALRDWGQVEKGRHALKGYNYRMDGIQGAVLGVKMRYIEEWTEGRRSRANLYGMLLRELGIQPPEVRHHARHVYHVYPVFLPERDRVRAALNDKQIQSGVHYPSPIHLQECFSDLGYGPGDFPRAERIAREELSLPMFSELTDEQVHQVVDVLGTVT